MAESTLSVVRNDLREEVSHFLAWGWDVTGYVDAAAASQDQYRYDTIESILKTALRRFYHPEPLGNEDFVHIWSFLRPVATLYLWATTTGTVTGDAVYAAPSSTVTVSAAALYDSMVGKDFVFDTSGTGYEILSVTSTTVCVVNGDASGEATGDTYTITADGDYRLPDDYGGLIGRFSYGEDEGYVGLEVGPEWRIREERQYNSTTGQPFLLAVVPETTDGSAGQRYSVRTEPIPDELYTMGYVYAVHANALTAANNYPYGGMAFAETLKQCCRAAADRIVKDNVGDEEALAKNMMEASIMRDRAVSAPRTLGYNGDRSIDSVIEASRTTYVTYEGVRVGVT